MRFDRGPEYDGQAGRRARSAMPSSCPQPTGSASAAAQCCRGSPGRHPAAGQSAGRAVRRLRQRDDFDGYCTVCGQRRAEPDRDEAELGGVVLITDRGIEHARNEDAAAAGILVGSNSRTTRCDRGRRVRRRLHLRRCAYRRGRRLEGRCGCDARRARRVPQGTRGCACGSGGPRRSRRGRGGDRIRPSAPSCTYTAAAVVPTSAGKAQITVGNVGDSRAYWLPEAPAAPQQLTVDDSAGTGTDHRGRCGRLGSRATPGAHPDSLARRRHRTEAVVGVERAARSPPSGRVRCCCAATDCGTTCPTPADIARFCSGTDASAAARALAEFALDAGGQDNITVVVIPIGGTS